MKKLSYFKILKLYKKRLCNHYPVLIELIIKIIVLYLYVIRFFVVFSPKENHKITKKFQKNWFP